MSGLSGVAIWGLLIWADSLLSLQIVQLLFGTYLATEVAYYTYIYAKVDREHYDRVTGHTRAAMFWGRFLGAILGQLLLYIKWMNYSTLNYITFAAQVACTFWVLLLPKVDASLYFHRKPDVGPKLEEKELESMMPVNNETPITTKPEVDLTQLSPFQLLWSQFKTSYSNMEVIQWSLLYTVSTCGYCQVIGYVQVLWVTIDNTRPMVWHGVVEALVTLLSALVTTFAEKIHGALSSKSSSLWILIILTTLSGLSIILGTETDSIFIAYLGYILFSTLFAFMITIASAEVAKRLAPDTFGLIFGINTMVALVMQSTMTLLIVSKTFMEFDVRVQFLIYAGFYFVFAFIYFLNILMDRILKKT